MLALLLSVALTVGVVAIEPPTPAHADALPTVPVMGPNILNAEQLTAWYSSKHRAYNVPGISVHDLAWLFLAEGSAEGVRGDIAFAQAMVETGYLGFVGSIVSPANWNFAGMGACDSCHSGTQFPSPQIGVRAQIQDLRNYADINSRASNMHNPLVPQWYGSPASVAAHNFDTFFRKGHAPTWNQMGNGNHADFADLRLGRDLHLHGHAVVQRSAARRRLGRGSGRQPRSSHPDSGRGEPPGLDRRPVEEQPDRGRHLRERRRRRAH